MMAQNAPKQAQNVAFVAFSAPENKTAAKITQPSPHTP
jgi:hypothetical protein